MSFLVVPLDVTPLPTFDPIRLPPTQANRGLLPPANPLSHELLDFWAEACAATLRCLMSAACCQAWVQNCAVFGEPLPFAFALMSTLLCMAVAPGACISG